MSRAAQVATIFHDGSVRVASLRPGVSWPGVLSVSVRLLFVIATPSPYEQLLRIALCTTLNRSATGSILATDRWTVKTEHATGRMLDSGFQVIDVTVRSLPASK